jgi:Rrf2 family transcriptional regulator, nitric oxide-sensitive transcriptional repressor
MISKTAEYALRAAVWMAKSPDHAYSANTLAEVTKVPRRYLHTVLQDLVRAGLVNSQPGPGGGYSLVKPADSVTILDVVNAVAPLERITHCPLGLVSHTQLCPLHKELDSAYATAQAALARVTLGELVRSSSKIVPLCEVAIHKDRG